MKSLCRQCGTVFLGRSDKVFCSDFCRNAYHYKCNAASLGQLRRIESILRKNRRILYQSYQRQELSLSRVTLADRGFNFSYFTGWRQGISSDPACYLCYDFGYVTGEDGGIRIVYPVYE